MAVNNAINLNSQGIAYFNGTNTFSGVDGATSGFVLTSNGTGVAPSFQSGGGGGGASISPYIVGTTGTNDFTTIQAAINQAVSDGASSANKKNIYVKPGTYNENLTVSDGIVVMGLDANHFTESGGLIVLNQAIPSALVTGTITYSGGVNTEGFIKNLNIAPGNNNTFLTWTDDGALFLVEGCRIFLEGTSSILVDFNFSGTIIFGNCVSAGTVGQLFNVTGSLVSASFNANSSQLLSGVASTAGASGNINIQLSGSQITGDMDFTSTSGTINVAMLNCNHVSNFAGPYLVDAGNSQYTCNYINCEIGGPSDIAFNATNTASQLIFQNCVGSTGVTGGAPSLRSLCSEVDGSVKLIKQLNPGNSAPFCEGSDYQLIQGDIQTLDDTPTLLARGVVVNEEEAVVVDGVIVASLPDHTAALAGTFFFGARRATGGDITTIATGGGASNIVSDSAATFTVVADVPTQSVTVQVTGVAATTYNWTATYRFQKMLTDV